MNRAALILIASLLAAKARDRTKGNDFAFTIRVTFDSSGHSRSVVVRYEVSGQRMRMEMGSSPAARSLQGAYSIVNGAASTFTTIISSSRTATVSRFPATPPDIAGHVSITDVIRGDSVDLGPGGTILGFPTRHYRVHTTAIVTTTLSDRVCKQKVTGIRETWVATSAASSILRSAVRSLASGLGSGFGGAASWLARVDAEGPANDLALRTIYRDSVTTAKGPGYEKISTREFTELSRTSIDSSDFAIPSGFRVRDLTAAPTDMPAGMRGALEAAAERRLTGCVSKTH